jgi:hypothetical protein
MEHLTRQELYDAIDRQSERLERIIDKGFDNVTKRMDIANGRTTKLEDRQVAVEKDVAVLLDRASVAEATAQRASSVASNSKWWSTGLAGIGLTAYELLKSVLSN